MIFHTQLHKYEYIHFFNLKSFDFLFVLVGFRLNIYFFVVIIEFHAVSCKENSSLHPVYGNWMQTCVSCYYQNRETEMI